MKKKSLIAGLTGFLLLFLMTAFANLPDGYSVGDKADDFKLKDVNGKMVSLADYKSAKGFIVVFTCNHCPFSKAYEQRILELNKEYSGKGYPVIAINPNDKEVVPEDSYEEMQKLAKEMKYDFPYLHDESQQTAKAFGATRTPHIYILKKEKDQLAVKYIGAIDDNFEDPAAVKTRYVENALSELMSNKEVTQNFTKAIGCTIKWKK